MFTTCRTHPRKKVVENGAEVVEKHFKVVEYTPEVVENGLLVVEKAFKAVEKLPGSPCYFTLSPMLSTPARMDVEDVRMMRKGKPLRFSPINPSSSRKKFINEITRKNSRKLASFAAYLFTRMFRG